MQVGCSRKVLVVGAAVFTAALLVAGIWVWVSNSMHQRVVQLLRVKNLKMLSVALVYYAYEHGRLPPAHTTNAAGKPMHSWRVLLLPYLDQESLYRQINLNEPWDSPANRRLLELIPEYYRSPLEADEHRTATNYFAVVGPDMPWWSTEHSKPWPIEGFDPILLVGVFPSQTPWMEPRDLTLDELLDMLRPENGNIAGGSRAVDIRYVTFSGDVGMVDPKTDRESLRKLFLGRAK